MDVERRFWQQPLYLTSLSLLVSLGESLTDLLVVRASPAGCNRCPSKSSACIHFPPLFALSFGHQKCGSKNIQRAMHSRCESGRNKQFQRLLSSSSGFRDEENFLALRWGCRSKREQLQNKFGNSQYLLNSLPASHHAKCFQCICIIYSSMPLRERDTTRLSTMYVKQIG